MKMLRKPILRKVLKENLIYAYEFSCGYSGSSYSCSVSIGGYGGSVSYTPSTGDGKVCVDTPTSFTCTTF